MVIKSIQCKQNVKNEESLHKVFLALDIEKKSAELGGIFESFFRLKNKGSKAKRVGNKII